MTTTFGCCTFSPFTFKIESLLNGYSLIIGEWSENRICDGFRYMSNSTIIHDYYY